MWLASARVTVCVDHAHLHPMIAPVALHTAVRMGLPNKVQLHTQIQTSHGRPCVLGLRPRQPVLPCVMCVHVCKYIYICVCVCVHLVVIHEAETSDVTVVPLFHRCTERCHVEAHSAPGLQVFLQVVSARAQVKLA